MKNKTKTMATLGLVFITFLAAIQYVFLSNVPDSVSSFAFVCITNVIGLVLLFLARPKQILAIRKKTLAKGAFFAVLLTGFNLFVLIGSHNMDSVVVSSIVSLYFVFITPILLLLRKKVNFFSGIATVMAIIALVLIFGGNMGGGFSFAKVIYLVIADICFAAYVVSVSILGEGEESAGLTFAQMAIASVLSLMGWLIEAAMGKAEFSIPTDMRFWVSAVFIGVFIRAVYGLLQISCQKHVSAINASLIFSSEIIMTMVMDPIMSKILGTPHTPATNYQVIGAVLLIIATLLVDETIMYHLGYEDMDKPSISKKIVFNTISFSVGTLILSTAISFAAIYLIRDSAVSGSSQLGKEASDISSGAMIDELERNISRQVQDKAKLAQDKLGKYSGCVDVAASYAATLIADPFSYPQKPVDFAREENSGKWTMQLLFASKAIDQDSRLDEVELLGNMEDVFRPIAEHQENIMSMYLCTEDGVMISYDRYSELGAGEENRYYEFRGSNWYNLARKSSGESQFTDTYWDGYGRGLTVTCVAPFYGPDGVYAGCVCMDILMKDLNNTMVSDGIVDPTVATMIDGKGDVIASGDLDPDAQETFNIFDENRDSDLKDIGQEILDNEQGIIETGKGEEAAYVAYSTIGSTGWKLCIKSPVSTVIEPAYEIKDSINSNTESVVSSVMKGVLTVVQSFLVMIALILLIVTLSTGKMAKRISDPLKRLENDVKNISGGNLDNRTQVNTDDEIGSLATSFNQMTDSLQKYIHDLTEATTREQRIASELSVATDIQLSMLPRNFEEFNSSYEELEIYATMTPAKEVGGDFYDFFPIDDDHIALVMADVSGKGVPAALFMVRAKTIIKNRVLMGGSPAEVLTDANEQLCEGNEGDLFVTVWLAIIELSTGKGIAANAGHEHPALRRADGCFELIKYPHSPAVALMEDMEFKEHEFEIRPGDMLFVYTDGVPEATSAEEELYGEERTVAALNKEQDVSPKRLLEIVKEDIDAFVKEAPQFDDLTMLSLKFENYTKKAGGE
ncbi:MAG: SpoIIE family protein phosphatase [Lachnospiraceae bacterium]|nr:SpoIIE family protein phosphatase [Lachnospiraceae bacterium]